MLENAYLGPCTVKACAVAKKAASAVVLESFIVFKRLQKVNRIETKRKKKAVNGARRTAG